jgi:hypothetical protein
MNAYRGADGKYHLVYKTTIIKTGEYYIGKHSTRILEDGYVGSGKLISAIQFKYGKEGLQREILAYCEDAKAAFAKEKELIGELYQLDLACLNLQPGGGGGFSNEHHGLKAQKAGRAFRRLSF